MPKAQRRSSHQKPTAANGGKVDALCMIAVRLGCQLAKYSNVFLANHRATGAEMVKEPTLEMTSQLPFSARVNQCVAKQATSAALSCINKAEKAQAVGTKYQKKYQREFMEAWSKPDFTMSFNDIPKTYLDSRFVQIEDNLESKTHPLWARINFPEKDGLNPKDENGKDKDLLIPLRKTRHMRDLEKRGYALNRGYLRIYPNGEVDLVYDKDKRVRKGRVKDSVKAEAKSKPQTPSTRKSREKAVRKEAKAGKEIGIDLGRSTAIATSDGDMSLGFTDLLRKVSRKTFGSNGYYRAKTELELFTRHVARNFLDYEHISVLHMEDLKNMKRGLKSRFKGDGVRHHHWRVALLYNSILSWAGEHRVDVKQHPAAYTNQRCSKCGHIHRDNRNGNRFHCVSCGYTTNADYNAAVNILRASIVPLQKRPKSGKTRPDLATVSAARPVVEQRSTCLATCNRI